MRGLVYCIYYSKLATHARLVQEREQTRYQDLEGSFEYDDPGNLSVTYQLI